MSFLPEWLNATRRYLLLFVVMPSVAVLELGPTSVLAQSDAKTLRMTPQKWIDRFADDWDETKWEKATRGIDGFMRPEDDAQWKTRMLALQGVVSAGEKAIPALLTALKHEDIERRIFAAQALGYLAPLVPAESLLEATKDPNGTVRLYAVDALGMKGGTDIDFESLKAPEKNRDVRSHINYAIERAGMSVDPSTVKALVEWDNSRIASAAIGREAPDIELMAATGEKVRLSSFRGKSAVVLVFIYGDT